MKYYIITLLAFFSLGVYAQEDMQELREKKNNLENEIQQLKEKLEYGPDNKISEINVNGEIFKCEVIRAYYNKYSQLCVDLKFSSKSDGELKFDSDYGAFVYSELCILKDNLIRSVNKRNTIKLMSGIPVNKTFKFNIYDFHFAVKPRLIEFLILEENQTNETFTFHNIAIDCEKD